MGHCGSVASPVFLASFRPVKDSISRARMNGSPVKSAGCFSRSPRFGSQYPHGSSQTSVSLVLGDPTPFSGL